MKPPCEIVMHKFIPALRAEMAIELYKEHGMNQIEIGRRIGTKQPSVSQYLSGLRGADHDQLTTMFTSFNKHKRKIIDEMLNNEEKIMTICDCCAFCKEIRLEGGFSEYYYKNTGKRWPCPDVE